MKEHQEKTIFQKIIDRDVPAEIVYEDDLSLAFHDVDPKAPTHVLVIPKKPIASLADLDNEDQALVGHLQLVIRDVADQLDLKDGYRVVANCGSNGGQAVDHLHYHVFRWPADEVAAGVNG